MKKILLCLALSVSMFAVSCSTLAERSIKELEGIVVEVENGCVDTEEEFENVLQSIESLNDKYKDVEYTPEQQREVDALNMRLSEALSEQFVAQLGDAFLGLMNGMVNGMTGFADCMQELVDDIQVMADEIENM